MEMSLRKKNLLFASSAAVALLLAACGGGGDTTSTGTDGDTGSEETSEDTTEESDGEASASTSFVEEVHNEGEPHEGEKTLKVALLGDSAFPGIFSSEFYQMSSDSKLMGYMAGSILTQDENFQWTGGEGTSAIGELSYDEENYVATIKIKEGVMWHGNDHVEPKEVTVDDIVFSYELIGHPDYQGVRYGSTFRIVEGMEDYKSGKADSISGLEVVDDYTLNIHFTENPGPQIYQAGGTLWAYAAPRHYYGDVPVTEIDSSPQIRERPIGFGPFKVENIVPGESVVYVANEDYHLGRPNIDRVVLERVPSSGIVAALEAGDFDITHGFPANQYPAIEKGLPGYTILGTTGQVYDYIGFKLGEWDGKKNVYDPDSKMADLPLRQAMAHALHLDEVGKSFFNGLRFRATSHIVPNFGEYFNEDVEGYPYDPEKANQLLDDAGYEDVDGDGFREDPNGEPLVITYAARAGGDTAEPIARYFLQAWKQIGLNVELLEGRLHESNTFYDRVQNDDPAIDVYEAGWGVGADPTPDGLYGEDASFNMPRYVSEENSEFIANMKSDKAFDLEYKLNIFHDWQEYFMNEAAPAIPTFWRTELQIVNNRVSDWRHETLPGTDATVYGLHAIDLLAESPLTE